MDGQINTSFWKGKKVLITGHTGFKGSWLSLWLQQMGAEVTGYALEPETTPSIFTEARVGEHMTSIIGDVTDLDHLKEVFATYQPEIVFHLAAKPLVRYSYQNPSVTFATNVMGTVNVLESVRHTPSVKAYISITSDKCYENKEWDWAYREDDQLGGHDPYSSSKACAELAIDTYRRSFFSKDSETQVASVRAGNVIGGGDWSEDRLIPDLIRGIFTKNTIVIRSPQATRPWQHVLEPLSGYIMTAEKLFTDGAAYAQAWNFGPDMTNKKTVAEIITELEASLEMKIPWKIDQSNNNPHEAKLLQLDSTKAHTYLLWRPKLTVSDAVSMTAKWYKAFYEKKDMYTFTNEQIREFVAL